MARLWMQTQRAAMVLSPPLPYIRPSAMPTAKVMLHAWISKALSDRDSLFMCRVRPWHLALLQPSGHCCLQIPPSQVLLRSFPEFHHIIASPAGTISPPIISLFFLPHNLLLSTYVALWQSAVALLLEAEELLLNQASKIQLNGMLCWTTICPR